MREAITSRFSRRTCLVEFLNNIRSMEKLPVRRQIINTAIILLAGIALGVFSKFIDNTPINELPAVFGYLDIGNFLGGFAPWILISASIAVFSKSPLRAAWNVFAFLLGMVTAYYLYSNFVSGFFPRSYAMIWIGITIVSPLLGFISWYANGEGWIAIGIAGIITGLLIQCAFSFGMFYVGITSRLNLLMLIIGIWILQREFKEKGIMLAVGMVAAVLMRLLLPVQIW